MFSMITDNTETQVATGVVRRAFLQVNAALTGTIKVIDGTAGSTANVATITNPTVGSQYEYFDLQNGLRIVASGACNITASVIQSIGR